MAQTIYRHIFTNHGLLQEVLYDLELLASEEHSDEKAEALFQGAMLHLHGLGTKPSVQTALKWLELSAIVGSLKSKIILLQILSAMELPLPDHLVSVLDDTVEAYPRTNQRQIAETISVLKADTIKKAVTQAKWSYLDLFTHEARHELVGITVEGTNIFALDIISGDGTHKILPLQAWLSPLQQQVILGDIEGVRILIGKGCAVDETRIANHTALWLACNCGMAEIAIALLKGGASPIIADSVEGYAPMHFLARFAPADIREVAEILVKHGADVEARSAHNETPLLAALDDERNFMPFACLPAVEALLDLGASPYGSLEEFHVLGDPRVPWPDCPLARACSTANGDVVIALLEKIRKQRSMWQTAHELPLSSGSASKNHGEPQDEYVTALMAHSFCLAVTKPVIYRVSRGPRYQGCLTRLVNYLLIEDVRSYLSERMGVPALIECCRCHAFDFFRAILKENLYSAADLEDKRLIPLVFATRNPDLVRQLISAGSSLSAIDDNGLTFLHHAVRHRWIVAELSAICNVVSSNLDMRDLASKRENDGATAFDFAVLQGSLELADFLAHFSVDVDAVAFRLPISTCVPFGWPTCTLLGYCLVTTKVEVLKLRQVRYLLKYRPAFRVSPSHGCTALTLCWTQWSQQRKRCKKELNPQVFH